MTECFSDLFLVCQDGSSNAKFFQIWINDKDKGFIKAQQGSLPSGTQAISFADIGMNAHLNTIRFRSHGMMDHQIEMGPWICSLQRARRFRPLPGLGQCARSISRTTNSCPYARNPPLLAGRTGSASVVLRQTYARPTPTSASTFAKAPTMMYVFHDGLMPAIR